MARGFWNGLLAGGIVGAMAAMFVSPQMKPVQTKTIVKRGKKMQNKAQRVIKQVEGSVRNIKNILD